MAEAWRNLTAVGAEPLAITDCLNFGNPERPAIMGQFAGCVTGMAEACRALDFPVVSGNVSFYNETNGVAIPPTPQIGGLGLIRDLGRMTTLAPAPDLDLIVLGGPDDGDAGWLGCSLYLREIEGREDGAPPPVDLAAERRTGDLVRRLIQDGLVRACHDVADGGLLVAVAEMALAGGVGVILDGDDLALDSTTIAAILFGEDQGRYILAIDRAALPVVIAAARDAGIALRRIGRTGGDQLTLGSGHAISVASLKTCHEAWLPGFMAGT